MSDPDEMYTTIGLIVLIINLSTHLLISTAKALLPEKSVLTKEEQKQMSWADELRGVATQLAIMVEKLGQIVTEIRDSRTDEKERTKEVITKLNRVMDALK